MQYLAAWLDGHGAVPLYNLMEDAATAEICRSMLWQWRRFEAPLDDGRKFDPALFASLFGDELAGLDPAIPRLADASRLFRQMVEAERLDEFMTSVALPALEQVRSETRESPALV